jgi:hypothetical protein
MEEGKGKGINIVCKFPPFSDEVFLDTSEFSSSSFFFLLPSIHQNSREGEGGWGILLGIFSFLFFKST